MTKDSTMNHVHAGRRNSLYKVPMNVCLCFVSMDCKANVDEDGFDDLKIAGMASVFLSSKIK